MIASNGRGYILIFGHDCTCCCSSGDTVTIEITNGTGGCYVHNAYELDALPEIREPHFKDDDELVETEEFDRPTAERPTPQHEPEPLDRPPKVEPRHCALRYLPQGPKGIEVEKRRFQPSARAAESKLEYLLSDSP